MDAKRRKRVARRIGAAREQDLPHSRNSKETAVDRREKPNPKVRQRSWKQIKMAKSTDSFLYSKAHPSSIKYLDEYLK